MRRSNFLNRQTVNSLKYGTESVSSLATKISDIFPKNTGHFAKGNKRFLNARYLQSKIQKMGSTIVSLKTLQNIFTASKIYLNGENLKICISLNKFRPINFSRHLVCQYYYNINELVTAPCVSILL